MGKTAQILTSIQTEIEMHLRQEYLLKYSYGLLCVALQVLFDFGIMFINFH